MNKDYSTISPSALSLLKMKAHTSIPFAKEAAALLQRHNVHTLPQNLAEKLYYWMRIFHFEARYTSINNLLADIDPQNILELSSGYSFRGLDYCINHAAHYIDTDLPAVIDLKKSLQKEITPPVLSFKGKLESIALNSLDEQEFGKVVSHFNAGSLTIVNEGLLMYLTTDEKKKLAGIIHRHLVQRGGYWITADIYIRSQESSVRNLRMSKEEENFFAQHNIDENKFESEAAAETFFKGQGFTIDKIATVEPTLLSSFSKLLAVVPDEIKREGKPMPKIQATWRLRAI